MSCPLGLSPPTIARSACERTCSARESCAWRIGRLIGALGSIGHEWAFMISPSLATALLAVDFTVPLDSPVVSAISASDSPP